jgi:hypothetical protein
MNSLLLDRIRLPHLRTKAPVKTEAQYPRSFPIVHLQLPGFTLLRVWARCSGFPVEVKVGCHSKRIENEKKRHRYHIRPGEKVTIVPHT